MTDKFNIPDMTNSLLSKYSHAANKNRKTKLYIINNGKTEKNRQWYTWNDDIWEEIENFKDWLALEMTIITATDIIPSRILDEIRKNIEPKLAVRGLHEFAILDPDGMQKWKVRKRRTIPRVFATKNRLIILKKNGAIAYKPLTLQLFITSKSSYDYDETKKYDCPMFKTMIQKHIEDPAARNSLLEFICYCLFPTAEYRPFAIFLGKKRTVKSTMAKLIGELAGGSIPLNQSQLSDPNGFMLKTLTEKNVCICEEWEASKEMVNKLKELTGGGKVSFNVKFKDAIIAHMRAKMIMVTNNPPILFDSSGAIYDRTLLIEFTKEASGLSSHTAIEMLYKELPGILQLVLTHYPQINKEMVVPEWSIKDVKTITDNIKPIHNWVKDMVIKNKSNYTSISDLWKSYKHWCRYAKEKPSSYHHFCLDLKEMMPKDHFRKQTGSHYKVLVRSEYSQ
ncbi:MAG: hypothetical protein DRQ48_03880 [Gammaproteobacteria bacterium]|nr:MAG: hypothetical protein DRQ48_03880 [Gammaproteobacteria bacterium]